MTGPTDKVQYERGHLSLWNPSSALCLAQLTNNIQGALERNSLMSVCRQKGEKQREREREEKQ